jgi:hypothetical protein
VQKTRDESVVTCSNQILNIFMSDISNNLEYVLDDISKLMSMLTIMMASKTENVAHNAHKQLRAIITLFSQILDLQIDDNNRDLMLERGSWSQSPRLLRSGSTRSNFSRVFSYIDCSRAHARHRSSLLRASSGPRRNLRPTSRSAWRSSKGSTNRWARRAGSVSSRNLGSVHREHVRPPQRE